ncbi:hypothetical protein H0H81_002007 [Sphagnurus paluster]|uniref:CsbD-like domain-containing protein n=1 Tax=Sphagnurus paluster TaxID=117069 RepID=A0A9P7GPP8_9AGAR|nr:hypothetical protein H0H81_002007 [Sphagnurus paluster]
MSSSGSPNKSTGQFHSAKGAVVETVSICASLFLLTYLTDHRRAQIGNLTGSESWRASGKKEHAEGEAEYKAAQAKGYAEGTAERIGGIKDSVVGKVTGDKAQEVSGDAQNEKGKAQQELNKNA